MVLKQNLPGSGYLIVEGIWRRQTVNKNETFVAFDRGRIIDAKRIIKYTWYQILDSVYVLFVRIGLIGKQAQNSVGQIVSHLNSI
jgi:hypothetical protein